MRRSFMAICSMTTKTVCGKGGPHDAEISSPAFGGSALESLLSCKSDGKE